jgi:hypothetical protein
MTHCYNCGHAGTFVLLVQFALAVPGPDARVPRGGPDHGGRNAHGCGPNGRGSHGRGPTSRGPCARTDASRDSPSNAVGREGRRPRDGDKSRRGTDSHRDDSSRRGNGSRRDGFDRDRRLEPGDLPTGGDLSLAVQCPVCDSTDVGVAATDLLARYGSTTTS